MKSKSNPLLAFLAYSAMSLAPISAASLYWKTSTAAAWDSVSWATTPGGTYDQAWASGSDVVFEDNAGVTLTITGPAATTNVASITANENVTVTPSSTLGTGGTVAVVEVAAGKTLDFAGQSLSTAAGTGFIKNGSGTWSLANGNAYLGGFTLNAGTVAVGGVNALGAGGSLTLNGGTVRATGATARDLSGKYAGGITLGGNITLGDTVANGALTFTNVTSLGAATRTLTINSAVTHTGIISGGAGAGLTKSGPGTLTLGGANTYTGTTTISSGTLAITSIGALPGYNTNGSVAVASGATLAVTNAVSDANITAMLGTTNFAAGSAIGFDTSTADRAYSAVLANTSQGSLGLLKIGTKMLTLSGNNTYSGGTVIAGSGDTTMIKVSHASALGTGSVLVNGAQNFSPSLAVDASLTVNNALTLKRGFGGSNRAILGLGSGSTWAGNITLDNTSASGLAAILAGGTTAANACIISGNIGFSTLGTGVGLALRTSNGFGKITGAVSLSTGTVQLLDSSKWEFSNASNTWGVLDISHASAITTVGAANTLSSTGIVSSTAGGTLQLNNQAGTTAYSQAIAGLSGSVKVGLLTGAATLSINNTTDQISTGVISGAISLVKSGAAKQTLSGVNTYTGSTTVNAGTLAFGTTGALGTGDLTVSSGTLDLRKGATTRFPTVANLTLDNATFEIGLNAGPDGIDVAGTTTISGTNVFKIHGSLPAGTYNLISSQAPLTGNFTLDTSDVTVSGFTGSYTAAVDGNNYVLTVGGTATPFTAYWRGDISAVWSDSISAPNSNWATDGNGTTDTAQLPGATTEVFFSAASATNTDTTLGANLSIYSLTFENGNASVGGANTLSILTTTGYGIRVLPTAAATLSTNIICTASIAVDEAGTLSVTGGSLGSGPLLIDGNLNLNTNLTNAELSGATTGIITRTTAGTSTLTIAGATNSTFLGSLNDGTGTIALAKTGTSTLTLSGVNSFSGGTNLSNGLIVADATGALGTGAIVFSGTSQRLSIGNDVTLSNSITLGANNGAQGAALLEPALSVTGAATLNGPISITTNPFGGGHFGNRSSGSFHVKGPITSSVAVIHRIGSVTYWGGGTGYSLMRVTGTALLGANNGLATNAVLGIGVSGAGTFDLAGYNQSLAGILKDVNAATIGNSSTTSDSLLTITGTSTFDGVIRDTLGTGTRKVSVDIAGSTLTLGGVNTYTGNTTFTTGALVLSDNAQLKFAIDATSGVNNSISGATATLNGDFNIDTTLADAALSSGSWTLENVTSLTGAYGSSFQVVSGATVWTATGDKWSKTVGAKTYTFDETTGILTLTSAGYDSWAATMGLTGADADFDADPDNDGLDNGLEFVLGGQPNPANPGANSTALLPVVTQTAGDMSFTFKRKDLSESGVSLTFQWSTDLSFPSPANDVAVGAVDSITDTIQVDVTEGSPDADTDTIVITVPAAKAAAGKIFGRLKATKIP